MGINDQFALQTSWIAHVRFGSKADIEAPPPNVRFTSESGHSLSVSGCPLMRYPLSEVCPALTASITMRMAWITTGALSIMMLCPACVSVMCTAPGTSAASSF